MMHAPVVENAGWGQSGTVHRWRVTAKSDEVLLDEKRLPQRCAFVQRSAGDALRQLTSDAIAGGFDTSGVQYVDVLPVYASDPQKTWSEQAREIALQGRASYRTMNGALMLAPLGAASYALDESDSNFSPEGLILQPVDGLINDVTVIGDIEPQAYVKDYFVGDGLTLRFYLSQTPFTKSSKTLFDEEYTASAPDPTLWNVTDPASAVSVSGGRLQIAGGTGADGTTLVQFVEQIELGGALVMQHGDVNFNAASSGVLGGLYPGAISTSGCLAGFSITPNGGVSNIQALVNGAATGPVLTTVAGHRYVFATRFYSAELYRRQQVFHSSIHPAGNGVGGAAVAADVRVVLEVQEIDPANPATLVAPATVLYDGLLAGAPGYCTYCLVNAVNMQCSIAFTRLLDAVDTEVRSALPGQPYATRLVGTLKEGCECEVVSGSTLEFYPQYAPAANELIDVRYRGQGRALARITVPASIAGQQRGIDDGLHGAVRRMKLPAARTAADCENAALAILDDATGPAWSGRYETWGDFLPGDAPDIFPGDGLNLNVASQGAVFAVIVREVAINVADLSNDHSRYSIQFANDASSAPAFEFETAKITTAFDITELTNAEVGTSYLEALTSAEITLVTSTAVTIDAGVAPPAGGGIEVRWSDAGWGPDNDRNLAGRFTTESFEIPRLSRVQTCYLQQYDASIPPKYSRYTTALHLDYPL